MTTTAAPTADAEATLALAQKFLEAINTRNADALVETTAEDATYELRVAPHPLSAATTGSDSPCRRWPPPGRISTSSPTTSTWTAHCSSRNGR